MKLRILTLLLFVTSFVFGQNIGDDTLDVSPLTPEQQVEEDYQIIPNYVAINLGAHLRNNWRGLNLGDSPVLSTNLDFTVEEYFHVGLFNFTTLNGRLDGFGNSNELYIGYQNERLSFFIDDYYFDYYGGDFFDWDDHYLELQLNYNIIKNFNIFLGYDVKSATVYQEMSVNYSDFIFIIGYLYGESSLNLMSEGGVTNIGFSYQKNIKNVLVEVSTRINPSYKNIVPDLGIRNQPLLFNVSLNYEL